MPLPGAGSAGYQWTWQIKGAPDTVAVRLGAGPDSAPLKQPQSMPRVGSTSKLLHVSALHPGHATIELALVRVFDPRHPPLARHVVEVEVNTP